MNEIISEDDTEMMGNKIKCRAKGSWNEYIAPAGDTTITSNPMRGSRPSIGLERLVDAEGRILVGIFCPE